MQLTIELIREARDHAAALQRIALFFSSIGQIDTSIKCQQAALMAQKLKVPKEPAAKQTPAVDPAPAAPIAAVKTAKEKAA